MESVTSNESVICPYCGHEHDPYESDGLFFSEETTEWDCEACGELFGLRLEFTWVTNKGQK